MVDADPSERRSRRTPARQRRPRRTARGAATTRCPRGPRGRSRRRRGSARRRRSARTRVDRRSRRPGRGGGRPTRRAGWRQFRGPRKSETRTTRPPRGAAALASRRASTGEVAPTPSSTVSTWLARSRPSSPARPAAGGRRRSREPPNVTIPSRFPRWVARWPIATATPSATSALRRSAVPNVIDGETSSRSHAVRARSGTWTRTCGTAVRAVTFQSIRRMSSPGSYGRTWASSVPPPRSWARYSPGSRPRIRRPIVRSRARRSASGVGPGPGRAGVRWAPAMALFQPVMRSAPRAARRHRMARPTD